MSEEGKKQALAVAKALKDIPFSVVYSSPLSRCMETAKEIARFRNAKVVPVEGLKEINHGEWEGLLAEEVERNYPELLSLWRTSPHKVRMPGGESLEDVKERVVKDFEEIVSSHSSEEIIVIVGHDATNKVIKCHVLGLGLEMFWTFKQANCGITVFEYEPETKKVVIHTANATSHLGKQIDFEVQKSL